MYRRSVVCAVSLALSSAACASDGIDAVETDESVSASTGTTAELEIPMFSWTPSAGQLFGWTPDFSVNVPGFDSLNRAYVRDRTTFQDPIPGTASRLRWGAWEQRSFIDAIETNLGCSDLAPCDVCFDNAGGDYPAQVVFDRDDVAYTVVHATAVAEGATCPEYATTPGQFHLLMLRSTDFGSEWSAYELPCALQYAMERPYSPEPLEGPPAVLLFDDDTDVGDNPYDDVEYCGDGKQYGWLRVLKPSFDAQGMTIAEAAVTDGVTRSALHVASHSGGGTQVISSGSHVVVVHGERIPEPENPKDPAFLIVGSPTYLTRFNLSGGALTKDFEKQLTVSLPTNDGHNHPALLLDTARRIHVMVGSHGCAFKYMFSWNPVDGDLRGWNGPSGTLPAASLTKCPEDEAPDYAGQTYAAFVRDRYDTLHLAYRRFYDNDGYHLVYQRRGVNASWSAVNRLVGPPNAFYTIYYHQLTIDHDGRLYLLFSFNTDLTDDEPNPVKAWFAPLQLFKYSAVFVSENGGTSWHLTSTADYDAATNWEPDSSAMADLDDDGRDDLANVYWKHGVTVHVDSPKPAGTSWAWTSRARRLADGEGVLQYPVVAGNVNYPNDGRDDLVFVFRHWTTGALTIRTKLSRADGGFDDHESVEPEGGYVPDPTYTNLVPLMGDVNGDDRADLVFLYRTTCGLNIRTKRSNGDGTWATPTVTCANDPIYDAVNNHASLPYGPLLGRLTKDPVVGKVDKRSDLVFVFRVPAGPDGINGTSDDNYLATIVKRANSDGTWTNLPRQWHGDGPGVHTYPHLLGDVNKDGLADLVFLFQHWQTGQFSIRVKLALGDGKFGASYQTSHGTFVPGYTPRIGDVTGDGCADIVMPYRDAADGDYRIATFRASCDGNLQWSKSVSPRLP
jgi:hypothetical protein